MQTNRMQTDGKNERYETRKHHCCFCIPNSTIARSERISFICEQLVQLEQVGAYVLTMADCIPFTTWTAAASEVASLAVVWAVANECVDRNKRIASSILQARNRQCTSSGILSSNTADTRSHNRFLRKHSVLGIARAGAELPRVNDLSITFDPTHESFGDFIQTEHSRRTQTPIGRSGSGIWETSVRRLKSAIQHALLQRLRGFWILLKVLLPLCWVAYAATPLCAFSMSTKLAISSAVVAPLAWDDVVRKNSTVDPKAAIHRFIRDSGLFRTLLDTLLMIGLPGLACKYPAAILDFFRLGAHRTRIQYGQDSPKAQVVDVYLPSPSVAQSKEKLRGLIFFAHGGAWGSGSPAQYRLIAKPFLERGMAVAIVGYRLYPEGDALTQVEDLELAASVLSERYSHACLEESELGVCLVGHSSGAHILAMMMVERLRQQMEFDRWGFSLKGNDGLMRIDSFVGLSGPYDIAEHFQFEASRGVEELSPMQPACGGKALFHQHSPSLRLSRFLSRCTKAEIDILDRSFPRVALVHGMIDGTVPVESSQKAAKLLGSAGVTKCDEFYLPETGHTEAVLDLMVGGPTQDTVLEWLESGKKHVASVPTIPRSVEEILSNAIPSF